MEFSGSCEPPDLSTGKTPASLQEQQKCWTAELSLQPHDSHSLWAKWKAIKVVSRGDGLIKLYLIEYFSCTDSRVIGMGRERICRLLLKLSSKRWRRLWLGYAQKQCWKRSAHSCVWKMKMTGLADLWEGAWEKKWLHVLARVTGRME